MALWSKWHTKAMWESSAAACMLGLGISTYKAYKVLSETGIANPALEAFQVSMPTGAAVYVATASAFAAGAVAGDFIGRWHNRKESRAVQDAAALQGTQSISFCCAALAAVAVGMNVYAATLDTMSDRAAKPAAFQPTGHAVPAYAVVAHRGGARFPICIPA